MTTRMESAVAAALHQCAERVRPAGLRRWSFELVNGRRVSAIAALEGDLLALRAPVKGPPTEDGWTLLVENGTLRGPARFAALGPQRASLYADVVIADPDVVPLRIAAAAASLQAAQAGKPAEHQAPKAEPPGPSPEPPSRRATEPSSPAGWAHLAEEQGWRVTRRADDRIGIELDAPGLMNQAFLEERSGEPIVSIELLRSGGLSPLSRRALSVFLLTLTARLHLVRAAVTAELGAGASGPAVRLATTLPPPPATGPELVWALEAISLACRLATREVRALTHEPFARAYLAYTTKE